MEVTSLRYVRGHEPAAAGPAPPLLRALPTRHQPLGADRGQRPGEPASGRGIPAAAHGVCLRDATRADLEDFLADLLARRSAATAATRYKVLRVLYRWLEEEEDVPNPMAKMRPPLIPEQPVPVILERPAPAAQGLRRQGLRGPPGHRTDHAAARHRGPPDELMSRTLADLDQDLDVLLVLGKGRRERALPYGAQDRAGTGPLSAGPRAPQGRPPTLAVAGLRGRLTAWGLVRMLGRRSREAGLPGLHPHQFRHTFAHQRLAEGRRRGGPDALARWRSRAMLAATAPLLPTPARGRRTAGCRPVIASAIARLTSGSSRSDRAQPLSGCDV